VSNDNSVPNGTITLGQVWTVAQWNAAWQSKVDEDGGIIHGPIIVGGTQSAPAITNPAIAGGTQASPTISSPTITTPTISGGTFSAPAITGAATLGGAAFAASATTDTTNASNISSGTLSGSRVAAVNLAASGNGGVTGILPLANVNTVSPDFTGTMTLNGVIVPTVASPAFTGSPTINGVPIPTFPLTAAETAASVTPTSCLFPELDVRRYGASAANSGATNATALQECVSVLAQHTGAEMVIPAGLVLNVTQVTFTSMSKFNVRCDGALVATAASPGTAFTNLSANQGVFTPIKISSCTKFKVYGKGWINNGFVDAVFITGCTDFDWSLDCRGNCTNAVTATGNSTMNGITIVTSNQFRLHDMTVDSVTSQNMNNSTDVFFQWENNIFLSGCTDFELGPNILSRKAGYGAFFVSSNCFDFSIHDNIGELCSGTACTIAFGGGGVVGQRFTVSGNLWRLNQEDAFCVTNQSGTNASINATITGNVASYNGWCNCSQGTTTPASSGGASLNFQFVDDFTIGNNSSAEHTTSGIALVGCARVSGDVGSIFQQVATGSVVIGVSVLSGAQDFKLSGGTISCGGSGAQSILINGTNADLQFANIAMPAGQISLSGTYSSCKFAGIVAVCPQAVSAPFDFIDCTIGVTTAGQSGIVVGNNNVKLVRTSGGASGGSGIGIVVNGVNDVVLEDCVGTATGTGFGIQVINSSGTNLRGCLGNATSGNAISVTGTCDRLVLIGCKGNSTSGNALNMALSTITNAVLISFRALAGAIVTTGTTFLAGMDVP
jgi:hypothetical protein